MKSFDWITFLLLTALSIISVLFVFSTTTTIAQPYSIFFKKQFFGVIVGIILYLVCSCIDYRVWMRWGYFLYFVTIGLLIFTLIKGTIGMGAQRWINFGLFKLQPSELTKLFLPAYITYFLYTHDQSEKLYFKDFLPILAMLFMSFVLIRKQPDLGTALIVLFSGLIMLWAAGISKKFFIYSALGVFISAPLLWTILKDYQKRRIYVFLGYGKSNKERYHIEQSHIAIGSGGLFGKGFLKGTQNRLSFLPESRTDFIFAIVCEEFGFFGALFLLLLYATLFLRLFLQIYNMANPFKQLFALGLLSHIVLSAIINIAMVIGLLPIVGIPLPLISYGISSLWATFISFGWISSIQLQR